MQQLNHNNIQHNENRDIKFNRSNKINMIKAKSNKFQLYYKGKHNVITLPQYITDFFQCAESVLKSQVNFSSSEYNIENMAVESIKSNEILINLNGSNLTRCFLTISFNGIEIIYKLQTLNDIDTEYILTKIGNNNVDNIVPNILIKI